MRPRKERRPMNVVRYDIVIIFLGATGSRSRRRMTVHKTIKIEAESGIFVDLGATDREAWNRYSEWIKTSHPGEDCHILFLEREIIRPAGVRRYDKLYRSASDRMNAEPEPLPETMPINRGF